MSEENGIGKIVIIEGVDGIGKTTLIEELKGHYFDDGRSVSVWKFPDIESPFGQDLYAMLHVREYFNSYAFQYGVVSQIFNELPYIHKAKREGHIVFIERAFLSVMAYGYAEQIPESMLRRLASDVKKYMDYDAMILLTSKDEDFPLIAPTTKFVGERKRADVSKEPVRYKGKWDVLRLVDAFMKSYSRDYKCLKIPMDRFRPPEELATVVRKYISGRSFR